MNLSFLRFVMLSFGFWIGDELLNCIH
jgi:hypothetical protein